MTFFRVLALVVNVSPESPAAAAGITEGDAIVAFNGDPIAGADELTSSVFAVDPGAIVDLTIVSDGSEETVQTTIEERPRS